MSRIQEGKQKLRSALIYLAAFSLLAVMLVIAGEGLYNIVLALKLNVGQELREKPDHFQLYAAGGSVMKGDPFGRAIPDIVSWSLSGELAGRRLNVIDISGGRDAIYPQAVKLIRLLRYRESKEPAALLLLCGHEEAIGGSLSMPMRFYAAFKRLSIHSLLLSDVLTKVETVFGAGGVPDAASYEYFLRAVVNASRRAGVTPILATLPANKDVEPGGAEVSSSILSAVKLESDRRYGEAAQLYAASLAALQAGGKDGGRTGARDNCRLYPGVLTKMARSSALKAYLEYRSGRSLMKYGKDGGEHMAAALTNDMPQLRARPVQNDVIRRLADTDRLALVDLERTFALSVPKGGYLDLVHPDRTGYAVMGRAFAEALRGIEEGSADRLRDTTKLYAEEPRTGRPYLAAAIWLMTHVSGSAPTPDLLNLAERDLLSALDLSPGDQQAELWLRIVRIARANGNVLPGPVCSWLVGHRAVVDVAAVPPPGTVPKPADFFPEWPAK